MITKEDPLSAGFMIIRGSADSCSRIDISWLGLEEAVCAVSLDVVSFLISLCIALHQLSVILSSGLAGGFQDDVTFNWRC